MPTDFLNAAVNPRETASSNPAARISSIAAAVVPR
jgi:hypothetical protein